MSVVVQQSNQADTAQGKKRFAALKSSISASFEFLAIVVIPALFLSSVIIAIQVLTPGADTFVLFGFPVGAILKSLVSGVMTVSVESAMCGCSVIARNAKKVQNDAKSSKYSTFGSVFFLLFLSTIAFNIFHLEAYSQYLELVRCAVAGFYAYLCHGDDDDEEDVAAKLTAPFQTKVEELTQTIDKMKAQHAAEIDAKIQKAIAEKVPSLTVQIAQNFASQNQENFSGQIKNNGIKNAENLSAPQQFFQISEEKNTDPVIKNGNNFIPVAEKKREIPEKNNVPETPRNYAFSRDQANHIDRTTDGDVVAVPSKPTLDDLLTPGKYRLKTLEEMKSSYAQDPDAYPTIGLGVDLYKQYAASRKQNIVEQSPTNAQLPQPRITKPLVEPSYSQINTGTYKSNSVNKVDDEDKAEKGYTIEEVMNDARVIAKFTTESKRTKAVNAAISSGTMKLKKGNRIREYSLKKWLETV